MSVFLPKHILFLVIFFPLNCIAQFEKEAMIHDILEYKEIISSRHIHPFEKISQEKWSSLIDSLISKLESGCNADEAYIDWLRINALLDDEHTTLYRITWYFPLRFNFFSEGVFLMAAENKFHKYIGGRLLAINQMPIDSVIPKIYSLIPGNYSWKKRLLGSGLINNVVLNGLALTDNYLQASYTLKKDNDTVTISARIMEKDSFPNEGCDSMLRFSKERNYWFCNLPDHNAIYFAYNACTEIRDFPINQFIDSLVSEIKSAHPQKIIIDLRMNGGGNSRLLLPLIQFLSTLDSVKTKTYVLINRNTFSSAVLNAYQLKKIANAVFVGEMTGGNLNHFGEIKSVVLKKTKIRCTYSTKKFTNDADVKEGILPDIPVAISFENRINCFDEILDAALSAR
jgi:hypothetical protein